MRVCVCVCVHVCVCVCLHAHACVCVGARMCAHECTHLPEPAVGSFCVLTFVKTFSFLLCNYRNVTTQKVGFAYTD